jgi:histidyl-tRNA synthetase
MSGDKLSRPKARLPRGFRDRGAAEIAAERACLDTIRKVYESYGFEPLETPAFEYTDALGKFLPDLDRPNEGVFSLQDDDSQWMSLRYDLTAPLARYVAENFQNLPKPFRRYQVGPVWRNEKPGPGRYREFTQFDADTVGSASPSADAELLMMTCDVLEELGLDKSEYIVKVNNRKLLDGVLEAANIDKSKRGTVLRAIDKFDRIGPDGIVELLGAGRKDESGDFTKGAGLSSEQIRYVFRFLSCGTGIVDVAALARNNPVDLAQEVRELSDNEKMLTAIEAATEGSATAAIGIKELRSISSLAEGAGYHADRIFIDPTIVRGLDYYTGSVFEAQLTFPVTNDAGESIVFGSVAGGGRYDDLVARFTGQQVPATGISIGVSRLLSVLRSRSRPALAPLVLVLVIDDVHRSFRMAVELRNKFCDCKIETRVETYVGTKKFGDQLKYADKRGAAVAVIEGMDEYQNKKVTLKNLALGTELAKSIEGRAEWIKDRPAQITVERAQLFEEVRKMLQSLGG